MLESLQIRNYVLIDSLDIRFPDGQLPDLLNAIEIEYDGRKVVAEVA